ncbi:MAG: hypothetical protein ACK4FR_02845 [Tabrizicola sp.]
MEATSSNHLLCLADLYGLHHGLSHWRVSYLVRGDGQFFHKLKTGKSCTLRTAARVLSWFSDNWPEDLEWPAEIARPPKSKREAA